MNVHKNAKLTPLGREQIVKRKAAGETSGAIATALGVSTATVCKWVRRHKAEGTAGLQDRTSRPRRLRKKTGKEQEDAVEAMRRKRMPFWKIAAKVGLSRATAARIGKARGLSLLSALEPEKPVIRYEKEAPGDMIHIDIKRLAVSKASGIA
jgi:transposase